MPTYRAIQETRIIEEVRVVADNINQARDMINDDHESVKQLTHTYSDTEIQPGSLREVILIEPKYYCDACHQVITCKCNTCHCDGYCALGMEV